MADIAPTAARAAAPVPAASSGTEAVKLPAVSKTQSSAPRAFGTDPQGEQTGPETARKAEPAKLPGFESLVGPAAERASSAVAALRSHGYKVELQSWSGDVLESKPKIDTLLPSSEDLRALLKTPSEMRADYSTVKYNPIVVDGRSEGVIRVYNLNAKTPLAAEFKYDAAGGVEAQDSVTSKVKSCIKEQLQATQDELDAPIEMAPTPAFGISFDRTRKLSPEQTETVNQIFEKFDSITVLAEGASGRMLPAVLNRESFERNGFSPLRVDGSVMSIRFEKETTADFESSLKSLLKSVAQPRTKNHPVVDSEGNRFTRIGQEDSVAGLVKTNFSATNGGDRTILMGGPGVKMPRMDGIFQDKNPELVRTDGQFQVWKMFDSASGLGQITEQIGCMQNGALHTAKYLGHEGAVNKLLVFDVKAVNAFFHPANPDSIAVYSETLRKPSLDPRLLGVHETAHLIDGKYDFQLSRGALREVWTDVVSFTDKETRRSFIDEQSFFGRRMGGHAWQNPQELFASAITSMAHPTWEEKAIGLPLKERAFYLACLDAIRTNMKSTAGFPQDAPVLVDLDMKIYFLERAVPAAERRSPAPIVSTKVEWSRFEIPTEERRGKLAPSLPELPKTDPRSGEPPK